jgi:hypothetical protein
MDREPPCAAIGWADRAAAIRRATARLCARLGWAPVHEVPLPNGRRADILALRADGGFACIEVKSGVRDFLVDDKWPEYRAFCDRLYFAVDADFPAGLLPASVGLIVAVGLEADLVREAPDHPLAPARRRSLLHRFATLAALRLAARDDPGWDAALRMALRVE